MTLGSSKLPSNGNAEERAQGNTEEKIKRDIFPHKNRFKTKISNLHLECIGK